MMNCETGELFDLLVQAKVDRCRSLRVSLNCQCLQAIARAIHSGPKFCCLDVSW